MCIIVCKPAGAECPTWKRLETCFDNNPDGAGFMWADGESVHVAKGFMEFSEFKKAFKMAKRQMPSLIDTPVVFHFRIKTSGEVSRECCHPFPLSGSLEKLRETETKADIAVAHNGVLFGRDTNPKKSDTMDFVMNFLYNLRKMGGDRFDENKWAHALISDALDGDRLCVLHGDKHVVTYGKWVTDEGVYYSNDHYKPRAFTGKRGGLVGGYGYGYSGYSGYSGYYDRDPWDDWHPGTGTTALSKKEPAAPYKVCTYCSSESFCKTNVGFQCDSEDDAFLLVCEEHYMTDPADVEVFRKTVGERKE